MPRIAFPIRVLTELYSERLHMLLRHLSMLYFVLPVDHVSQLPWLAVLLAASISKPPFETRHNVSLFPFASCQIGKAALGQMVLVSPYTDSPLILLFQQISFRLAFTPSPIPERRSSPRL